MANQASSQRSGNQVQSFSILFIIILLLFVFRSPIAAIVTLLPSGLALAISMRLIGELGAHGLKISAIAQVLLIVLLLGAGTDYGLFLVFRVREELRAGRSPHDAVRHAMVRVGESITASAATVILALLTLLFASFGFYKDLGIPLAIGVLVILLLGLTLLPALLALLGKRAFWPAKIEAGSSARGPGAGSRAASSAGRASPWRSARCCSWDSPPALSDTSQRASVVRPAHRRESDAAAGNAAIARHFPQSSSNPANLVFAYQQPVWQAPAQIAAAQASLRSSGQFTALLGPLDANGTRLTPAQYSQLFTRLGPPNTLPITRAARREGAGGGVRRLPRVGPVRRPERPHHPVRGGARRRPQQSTAAMNATPRIRRVVAQAVQASGASAGGVAGQAAASYDISTTANHDLVLIIPIAAVAIALVLALVLRSLVAPVYLIASVVLSYLAALGVATIVFIDITGDNGISFFLPFLMFVFLLALGEDYNILVMTRIREEARHLPLKDAVIRAVSRTGTTVTSAGIILGGTFAVLAATAGTGPNSSQLRAIGIGLAVGILMDTFLVRTLLVPATVILLGRWNWWPSAMGRNRGRAGPGGARRGQTPGARARGRGPARLEKRASSRPRRSPTGR